MRCVFFLAIAALVPTAGKCFAEIISEYKVISTYTAEPGIRTLSFGGQLADGIGSAITGTKNLQFDVYDAATGGISLYSEFVTAPIQDGALSHQLGTITPLGASVFAGYDGFNRYLAVTVDGVTLGRSLLNNSGQTLSGTGFKIQDATSISAYIAEPGSRSLSFGGQLNDGSGNPITGTKNLQFDVYDAATGGIPLYSDFVTAPIQDGALSYQLGTNTPLDASVFVGYDGFNRYLAVTVDGVTLGRSLLNNSGQTLSGTGFQVQDATSISAYIAEPGNRSLSFGGQLTDTNGNPINGLRDVQYDVYDAAMGGISLHSEFFGSTSIQNGAVSHQLGTNVPLNPSLFMGFNGFNRFLAVTVDGTEIDRFALNTSFQSATAGVPEPSSLLLTITGAWMTGAFGRRNRRRK